MYNWSVDEAQMKKADPKGYEIWRLEQMINYGEPGEKINERKVRKHWNQLNLDPSKKQYLEFLLFDKPPKRFIPSKFQWHPICRLCNFLQGRNW